MGGRGVGGGDEVFGDGVLRKGRGGGRRKEEEGGGRV